MKKAVCIILALCMSLSVAGIAVVLVVHHDTMFSVFGGTVPEGTPVMRAYITIALLLLCWVVLFILLIRSQTNGNIRDYGVRDALTGLPNKKSLREQYESTDARGNHCCLCYIATDGEDLLRRHGREMSETLQKKAAHFLSGSCTEYDCVARVEDGVFAYMIYCKDMLSAQQRYVNSVNGLNKLCYDLLGEGKTLFRGGIYLPRRGRPDFESALHNARLAYQYACDEKSVTLLFNDDLSEKEESRNLLRKRYINALENREFEAFLQFVRSEKANAFVGAEILSRWNDPDEGFLMPAYYIGNMHRSGLIERFDLYMLDKTCALLERWSGDEQFSHLMLACNITKETFASGRFLNEFKAVLKKYHFDRHLLILETTGEAFFDKESVSCQNVMGCRAAGVQIALDGFAFDSISLSDLKNCPVDHIKVDRRFINQITTEQGAGLLTDLVQSAHRENIAVVCEGVETDSQRDAAGGTGCDYVQGYYYSYVFPVDEGRTYYLNSLKA